MPPKIKPKLSHKLFLGIFVMTLLTFILCFIVVDRLLLERYMSAYQERLGQLIEELGEELETRRLPEVDELINHFAFENHANIEIVTEIYDIFLLEEFLEFEPTGLEVFLNLEDDAEDAYFAVTPMFNEVDLRNSFAIFSEWGHVLVSSTDLDELVIFMRDQSESLAEFEHLLFAMTNAEGEGIIITNTFDQLVMFIDLQNFENGDQREFEHLFLFNLENAEVITETFEFTNPRANVRHFVTIDMSFAPATHVINHLREMVLPLFVFIVAISLFISLFFAYSLSHPIVRISRASSKMKQLKLSERIELKRQDEIGELAENLNDMAHRLHYTMENLTEANAKLQKEMEKEKEREKQRKDFFMAVSHELKTPLTILKTQLSGMVEGIGIYKDREQYLQKSYNTTEQLTEMVASLLNITHLSSDEIELNLETINISRLVEETCHQYETFAAEKSISLTHYLEPQLMAQIDHLHFSSVISNVTSNALRHTANGQLVDIQLIKKEQHALLTVENYGATLPEEDLKQLFEPFYRTDKSRNRYTGGSGLGLYITKNILELHGFSYDLANTDNGVIFTIEIPLTDDLELC